MFELWGRSEAQITKRARELGLKNEMRYRNHWTAEEIEYLVSNFASAEWGSLVDRLNRPGIVIREKAAELELERKE